MGPLALYLLYNESDNGRTVQHTFIFSPVKAHEGWDGDSENFEDGDIGGIKGPQTYLGSQNPDELVFSGPAASP